MKLIFVFVSLCLQVFANDKFPFWEVENGTLIVKQNMVDYDDMSPPWMGQVDEITEIVFRDGVDDIGNYSFMFMTSVIRVNFGNNTISRIGDSAFLGCENLSDIILPVSLTNIGPNAFSNCNSLKKIAIPENILTIYMNTFFNCTNLISVSLPINLKSIESSAFSGCISLTEISLPEKLEVIEKSAFQNCKSLTSLVLPKELSVLGGDAFNGCSSLKEITFGIILRTSGSNIFKGVANEVKITLVGTSSMADYTEPSYAPWYDLKDKATSITIQEGILSVGKNAFNGFTQVTEVSFPKTLKSVQDYAFTNCTSIQFIKLDCELSSIGHFAFTNLTQLRSFEYTGETNPSCLHSSLENSTAGIISVTSKFSGSSFCYHSTKFTTEDQTAISFKYSTKELKIVGNGGNLTYQFNQLMKNETKIISIDNVTLSNENLFTNFIALEKISIGKSISTIHKCSFEGCNNLSKFTVDQNNTMYLSLEKVLVSIDNKTLYKYAVGNNAKTYIVPETIEKIEENAFRYSTKLNFVGVKENVKSFGNYSFADCPNLSFFIYRNDQIPECTSSVFKNVNFEYARVKYGYPLEEGLCGKKAVYETTGKSILALLGIILGCVVGLFILCMAGAGLFLLILYPIWVHLVKKGVVQDPELLKKIEERNQKKNNQNTVPDEELVTVTRQDETGSEEGTIFILNEKTNEVEQFKQKAVKQSLIQPDNRD